MKWSGWRSPISFGFSAASASASPTQNGTERSQTAWLAPWWSGWAWVSAWAETSWPSSSRTMRRVA